ncbi:hypothetical protein RC1_1732 [Rhodospirillum centenum SW]|uniref:Uncharacterized protein n=1 Tax=Rhodospirillum centenum (strain ATCC 51521 / SW) TaxID=414684 RepID=B6ITB1_RHOCS|nr:hypothetical protein RC1_1732 [Rhodospirillum centenum SW]
MQAGYPVSQNLSAGPAETGQQHLGRWETPFIEGCQRQHGDPRRLLPLRAIRLDIPDQQFDGRFDLGKGDWQVPADSLFVGELQPHPVTRRAGPGHLAGSDIKRQQQPRWHPAGFPTLPARRLVADQGILLRECLWLQRLQCQPGIQQSNRIGRGRHRTEPRMTL